MVAQTESGVQTILDSLSNSGKEFEMKINVKLYKVMRFCRDGSDSEGSDEINITKDEQVVEQATQIQVNMELQPRSQEERYTNYSLERRVVWGSETWSLRK